MTVDGPPGNERLPPELAGTVAAVPRRRRRRRGRRGRRAPVLGAVAAVVAVVFAAPLAYLAIGTLSDPEAWGHLTAASALAPLARTLTLAVTVSAGATVLGTGAAWLVVRTDLPGRRVWRLLLPLPLVIPSFLGAFALIAALAPGGLVASLLGVTSVPQLRGLPGSFLVLTLLTYPYVYLPVAARLHQLPPSIEEAARLFGRPPRRVFTDMVLPQIRSAVLAGTLLVFLYSVSEFGAVQLLRYDTYTRLIYAALKSFQLPAAMALGLQLGVLALLVVLLERGVARAPVRTAAREVRGLEVPLGRWRALATAAVAGLVGMALVAPVAVLSFWAFRGIARGTTRSSALVADLGRLLEPAWNTTRVSVAAAVLSMVVVLPVAYLTVRRRTVTGSVSNGLVVAGFALPGLVVALALVSSVLGLPVLRLLYQTTPLLVVAYVVHFGAQSLRAAEVAVASVPPRLEDAARALGAGRVRRFLTVELPLMLPGLLAGGGLVLLSTMKELPATLVLAPPGFETLATRVWNASQDVYLADASIAGLLLIALSGVLTWVLVVRRSNAL